MSTELKPCTHCGGAARPPIEYGANWRWSVDCSCCEATGPIATTAAEAVAAWNRRAYPECERLSRRVQQATEELRQLQADLDRANAEIDRLDAWYKDAVNSANKERQECRRLEQKVASLRDVVGRLVAAGTASSDQWRHAWDRAVSDAAPRATQGACPTRESAWCFEPVPVYMGLGRYFVVVTTAGLRFVAWIEGESFVGMCNGTPHVFDNVACWLPLPDLPATLALPAPAATRATQAEAQPPAPRMEKFEQLLRRATDAAFMYGNDTAFGTRPEASRLRACAAWDAAVAWVRQHCGGQATTSAAPQPEPPAAPAPVFGKCGLATCRAVSGQVNHGYCHECWRILKEHEQPPAPVERQAWPVTMYNGSACIVVRHNGRQDIGQYVPVHVGLGYGDQTCVRFAATDGIRDEALSGDMSNTTKYPVYSNGTPVKWAIMVHNTQKG